MHVPTMRKRMEQLASRAVESLDIKGIAPLCNLNQVQTRGTGQLLLITAFPVARIPPYHV